MEDQQTLTLEAYRQAKETGVDLYQEVQEDAAPSGDEQVQEDVEVQDNLEEQQDDTENAIPQDEQDDDLPPDQKNAFYKRLQREVQKKSQELEGKIKSELEQQYNPYKAFFDRIGVDPQKAMEAIEKNRIQQEAYRIAEQQGWTDQETQMYIRQQQLEKEQTDMRVSLRVYELADSADYPGIKQMKGAITEFIRENPRASVEQAYWAVGGSNLAQQMKREAEQREIAKRTQSKRTVATDTPSSMQGPQPLPPEAVSFMRRTGMSESEVRMLLHGEGPKNLEEYRKMMKQKG